MFLPPDRTTNTVHDTEAANVLFIVTVWVENFGIP